MSQSPIAGLVASLVELSTSSAERCIRDILAWSSVLITFILVLGANSP